MDKRWLEMEYHPAMKEVRFKLLNSGGIKQKIGDTSRLWKYIINKGKFILQDRGDIFFEDICAVLDGEKEIEIKVTTTKDDFGDFEEMVENFNNNDKNKQKINATLLAELPDMNETYEIVKQRGMDVKKILEEKGKEFLLLPQNIDEVKTLINEASNKIKNYVKSMAEKISALEENNVNLCFAGVYSAGKSALINAILGYAILPEALESETGKMCVIRSPRNLEKTGITFQIDSVQTQIDWNENEKIFKIVAGPEENEICAKIQEIIDENKSEEQYHQLCEILRLFNKKNEDMNERVSPQIDVRFQVPFDNEKLQYTIYDTPGTDSNSDAHKGVLEKALSEQTNSILIFVVAPGKLEGEGNNALLEYIKKAEQNADANCIDIARSLFVINRIENEDIDELKEYKQKTITHKDDKDFSIKLTDKKIFFTSAKFAYSAKACKNDIATEKNIKFLKKHKESVCSEEDGRFFRFNHSASSEAATQKMLNLSKDALQKAVQEENETVKCIICSGVYSLEQEIEIYGRKFSSAVRTYAIIKEVDETLKKLDTEINAISGTNEENINKKQKEIDTLKKKISDKIDKNANEYVLDQSNGEQMKFIAHELHLNPDLLQSEIIGPVQSTIPKKLKKFFFNVFGNVHLKDWQKDVVLETVRRVVKQFLEDHDNARKKLLLAKHDEFVSKVKEIIDDDGNLSKEAKEYILNIQTPDLPENNADEIIDEVFKKHTFLSDILQHQRLDRDKFEKDVRAALSDFSQQIGDKCRQLYVDVFNDLITQIKNNYKRNIESYSLTIEAMIKDRNSMERLKEKLTEIKSAVESKQKDLNNTIWRKIEKNV